MPPALKKARANFVIANAGTLEELRNHLDTIWAQIDA